MAYSLVGMLFSFSFLIPAKRRTLQGMKCLHPCACDKDPCPHHGPKCLNPSLQGGLCKEHGCRRCGGVILADTEDHDNPLCFECYEASTDARLE